MLQEEGWVVCRVFKKKLTTVRKMDEHEPLCNWYDGQVSFMPDFESPRQITHDRYSCKQELDQLQHFRPHERYLQLPQLERLKVQHSAASVSCSSAVPYVYEHSSTITQEDRMQHSSRALHLDFLEEAADQVNDWQVLEKFVASQLSQDNEDAAVNKETRCSNDQVLEHINMLCDDLRRPDHVASESTSISSLSCQTDLWK